MFCPNCNKLYTKYCNKNCMKCKGTINQSIAILCDTCSLTTQSCAACLRRITKTGELPLYKSRRGGCKACGSK